jgi:putative DNA primase/helicase
LHIYFIQPDGDSLGNREGSLPKSINIRGAGGYVIAPYCVRAGGTFYEPLAGSPDLIEAFRAKAIPPIPKWLIDLIRAQPVTPHAAAILRPNFGKVNGNRCRAYAQAALHGQIAAVSATPSGGRNIALNSAAFRLGRMLAREWIGRSDIEQGLRFAAQECGLLAEDGERSVNATIQSGLCAGLTKPAAFPGSRR